MKNLLNKLISFYQGHRLLIFFSLFAIFIGIGILAEQRRESELNSWNGIQIGKKFSNQQIESMNPIEVTQENGSTIYSFQSSFKSFPNEVVLSSNQTAVFIKEYIVASSDHTLGYYTNQIGEPDLLLEVPEISHSVLAAVFLDEGLVVVHDSTTNLKKVIQKWYFEPMNKTEFLSSWGSELEEQEKVPQPHPALIQE